MNEIAQANTSVTEESNWASEELDSQVNPLSQLVTNFQLGVNTPKQPVQPVESLKENDLFLFHQQKRQYYTPP